jgi:phosphatidylglycerophosphatase A
MMRAAKLIATCLGIGYIRKGAGTVAAAVCCVVWYLLAKDSVNLWIALTTLVVLFFAGVWCANTVEGQWGEDSNRVVIDEWFGMSVSLVMAPVTWQYILLAFLLFRFFDIAKPLYIRRAEQLPNGWGVMADDLLAALYSGVLLLIASKTGLFL